MAGCRTNVLTKQQIFATQKKNEIRKDNVRGIFISFLSVNPALNVVDKWVC